MHWKKDKVLGNLSINTSACRTVKLDRYISQCSTPSGLKSSPKIQTPNTAKGKSRACMQQLGTGGNFLTRAQIA